jgi:hypothetical protein
MPDQMQANQPLSEAETERWNDVFGAVCPAGVLPSAGSPAEQTLGLLANYFGGSRLFDPVVNRPLPWLTERARIALLNEAESVRHRAVPSEGMLLAYGGSLARTLIATGDFRDWARDVIPAPLAGDIRSGFLFYDGAQSYCPVHIDRPLAYEVNLLVTLDHRCLPGVPKTRSFFVEPSGFETYGIAVGEGALIHATATLHGRLRLKEGEVVRMLSIGFGVAHE